MRVLVCGGRDYNRYVHIYDVLTDVQDEVGAFEVVIAGRHPGDDKSGADYWAESWSFMQRIPFYGFPARWGDIQSPDALVRTRSDGRKYDAKAGPRRNARMIAEGKPDLVIAFPGRKGTADMVRQAKAAGVRVMQIPAVVPAELPLSHP